MEAVGVGISGFRALTLKAELRTSRYPSRNLQGAYGSLSTQDFPEVENLVLLWSLEGLGARV